MQSITFPTPGDDAPTPMANGLPEYIPFSTAPVTVSRAIDDTPAPSTSTSTDTHAAPPPPPAAGMDLDEVAEAVIEKLRHEMIIERDLGGGAMDLI
jgi:hypothetical protein